jgi:hypothetical protein
MTQFESENPSRNLAFRSDYDWRKIVLSFVQIRRSRGSRLLWAADGGNSLFIFFAFSACYEKSEGYCARPANAYVELDSLLIIS